MSLSALEKMIEFVSVVGNCLTLDELAREDENSDGEATLDDKCIQVETLDRLILEARALELKYMKGQKKETK
jgi:hypothetical protein